MSISAFPSVPEAARGELPRGAALRRFGGEPGDLDVDFGGARAEVTDAVVAGCAEPPIARDAAARLPVSVRIRALLRVAAAEEPAAALIAACGCGEVLEVVLPLEAVAADPARVEAEIGVGGRRVRVPTGEDQRAVAASGADRLAIVRALAGDAAIGEDEVAAIEAALDEADPLVGFHVAAVCPGCGAPVRHDVDLEGLAHGLLARAQEQLVDAIHRLASAYHWSEREVLALPPRRRAQYLARIERGAR